jgi:hypothetical protein
MPPITSDPHYHVINHVVDITNYIIRLLTWDVIRIFRLELFKHELV